MDTKIWLTDPEEHDFPAAQDYLGLHFDKKTVRDMVKRLQKSPTITKKAKDVLRASGLPLLPKTNIHVAENIKRVEKGKKKLSPVLLVRNQPLIVADGYHRVCAIYYLSEDNDIPCRLTGIDKA